jgi:subtilisin family serine protease
MKSTPYVNAFMGERVLNIFKRLNIETRFAAKILCAVLVCIFATVAEAAADAHGSFADPQVRRQAVEQLAQQSRQRKAAAEEFARSQGLPVREKIGNSVFEIMAVDANRIYAFKTCNQNSAISIGVDLIRNTAPYYLNGQGVTVGIWDGGAVSPTHQELNGRVTLMETMSNSDHSTHVGGTIAAAGIVWAAMGMAPSGLIDSYDWNNNISEMANAGMSYPNEPGTIQLSNHSYTFIAGWEDSFNPPQWHGTWGDRESDLFGQYNTDTADWDMVCYNAPYFLPFNAAGNDRDDQAPAEGTLFQYYKFPTWRNKMYDSSTDPYSDGWDNGGFDTIPIVSTAKNTMTVGAVDDAVVSGVRDPNMAAMAAFSAWGPTDDGRIKPDLVTNGINVYSSTAGSTSSYATYTGTSMAAPAAAGAAALLVDYFSILFSGQAMRASTIKALLIHTADDLGNSGPDYKFGWGLLNAKAAADQIADHNDYPDANKIVEGLLNAVNTSDTYSFEANPNLQIRATLCWTDPAASPVSTLDNPSPRLKNDLDLRIIDPNLVTHYPFVLNPASPNDLAATGDNIRDNVEQILIEDPQLAGTYTIQVTYKGSLTNGQQYYSLIISGQQTEALALGDFNGDGFVDYKDLGIFSQFWLTGESSVDIAPEGGDGSVNLLDFARFAQDWD